VDGATLSCYIPTMHTRACSAFVVAVVVLFLLASAIAQAQPADTDSITTFRASTSLVLVDVRAHDTKTGRPIEQLTRDDFEVSDNGHRVEVVSLDTGAYAKPIALWLVALCNYPHDGASGEFFGKANLFRPALDKLSKRDKVAVAHWCDNGDARGDLLPTDDRDLAIESLGQVLQPLAFQPAAGDLRKGELACQSMLRGIVADAVANKSRYLPVIVFLHGDWTGAPQREIDVLIGSLLESQGMVYGIKDKNVADFSFHLSFEIPQIFHYLADNTAGEYFSVPDQLYAEALGTIIDQVHFRYQLGFRPAELDGRRHKLKVKLSDAAKKKYRNVRLHARNEYVAMKREPLR
jgi:hypothetical protein